MIAEKSDTKSRRIFPARRWEDVVIVSPKGDSLGFSRLDFRTEKNALLRLIDGESAPKVLFDLSGANYFGSEMIGFINEAVLRVQARGGSAAVCEISDDMRESLHLTRLDEIWPIYGSRQQALRALSPVTPLRLLKHGTKWIGASVLLLMSAWFAVTYAGEVERNRDRNHYETLSSIWDEWRRFGGHGADYSEKRQFVRRARRQVTEVVDDLHDNMDGTHPIRHRLNRIACDHLLPQLKTQNMFDAEVDRAVTEQFATVRNAIEARERGEEVGLELYDDGDDDE